MSEANAVDGTKVMDVVFTVSGGVYGMVKDKVNALYTSGVLQGKLPTGAVVTGVAFDVANDAIKLTVAVSSGDPREVAKAAVTAVGGAAGTYLGGYLGALPFIPLQIKPVTILTDLAAGSIFGDTSSEWIFDTYVWPKDSATPSAVNAAGMSLDVNLSSTPQALVPKITTPADAPERISSSYITSSATDTHAVVIGKAGTVWDAYKTQVGSANGFSDWNEFKAAVAASNPNIADLNQVSAGATLYLPQKMSDGSVTYHYENGASVNNNTASGAYYMVVPSPEGGQSIYSRQVSAVSADTQDSSVPTYTIQQISTDADGQISFSFSGQQTGLDGEIVPSTTANDPNSTARSDLLDAAAQSAQAVMAANGGPLSGTQLVTTIVGMDLPGIDTPAAPIPVPASDAAKPSATHAAPPLLWSVTNDPALLNTQVDALISAMAAFAPPAPGQTTLPTNYQTTLNPMLAANPQ